MYTALYQWCRTNRVYGNYSLPYKNMWISANNDRLIVDSNEGGACYNVASKEITSFAGCTDPQALLEKAILVLQEPNRPVPETLKNDILRLRMPPHTWSSEHLERVKHIVCQLDDSWRSFELLWKRMTELEMAVGVCRWTHLGREYGHYVAYQEPYQSVYAINDRLNELRPEGERDVRE